MRLRRAFLLLLAALAPLWAGAQQGGTYEARYGRPIDVSIDDLLFNPESYNDRAVRTRGRLQVSGSRLGGHALAGMASGTIEIAPTGDAAAAFDQASRDMLGRQIEIVGVFQAYQRDAATLAKGQILFWSFMGPPEEVSKSQRDKAEKLTLEALAAKPGGHDGRIVRVVGQFRGRNLYGDLPVRSQLANGDWVVKDDLYAVWVTGKKPKGSGFALDSGLKRDTGKWLEVVGRVETRGDVTYLHAIEVGITTAPSPTARVEPPPPPKERPKLPPEIVFSLPLDGERDVPQDGNFTVQFSKDMRSDSFSGRVRFRYAGAARPGDRGFDGLRWVYDDGRRALTVIPGDRLQAGRTIEMIFLEGIVDDDGLALAPRAGRFFDGAVEVLRWQARASF